MIVADELNSILIMVIDLITDQSVKGKSKYVASDDSQDSEVDELESESEAGSEVPTPKKTPKSSAKGKGKAKESAKAKGKKATAPRKRKTKELDEEDEEGDGGPVVTKGDLIIFDDNDLFSKFCRSELLFNHTNSNDQILYVIRTHHLNQLSMIGSFRIKLMLVQQWLSLLIVFYE